jgi:large subunit ribosomal protein L10
MAVSRADKIEEVQLLERAFRAADSVILVDYKGLKVPEATELRRQIKAVRAAYRVVKNTLARRAIQGTRFAALAEYFRGTTAVAYTADDPVALARALTTFARTTPTLTIKAGFVQGRALKPAEVSELAALPGKAELHARLVGTLQAPLVHLLSVLAAAPRNLLSLLTQYERKRQGEPHSS